jgi:hypothetical protein
MTIRTVTEGIPCSVHHVVDIPPCCPITGNPLRGSTLRVSYRANDRAFPIEDLEDMIREYVGGHKIRSIQGMEEMIQNLAVRACVATGVKVRARADLLIIPPQGGTEQRMAIFASASP